MEQMPKAHLCKCSMRGAKINLEQICSAVNDNLIAESYAQTS